MLTLVYMMNNVDRQILIILLEPIKADLGLNDTQLGLLTGIAFAIFYSTLGIPVAIWADRGNRRNIVALALTIWSSMTALSGFAQNFWHLLLARMGVGIGEAGGTPPSTSMIADLYGPEERATALGIYTTGVGLGILVGFGLGGLISELYGWRVAFFIAGVPGLLLAILVRFAVREPLRGFADDKTLSSNAPSTLETLSFIKRQSSYLLLLAGCLCVSIYLSAYLVFVPSFLQRTYNLSPSEVAIPLGLLIGILSSIGTVVLGRLCDHLSKNDKRWRPWIIALSSAMAVPFFLLFLQASTPVAAYVYYAPTCFVGLVYASIAYTASQELVLVQMRAFASAFTLFCITLIGIGFGPGITGVLSDYFAQNGADRPLGLALTTMLVFNILGVGFLLLSTRTYREDLARVDQAEGQNVS